MRMMSKSLQKAVANQPVSIAITIGGSDFQLYQSVQFLSLVLEVPQQWIIVCMQMPKFLSSMG